MNRTDRLLAIVLELQGKRRQRSEDLAATFEVSKRTIYRDILALCEMGVPVVAVPGQGYSLMEGYFLPPLRFSTDEAVMLLLGSDVMSQSFDAEYRLAAESAGRKIASVLPEEVRRDVQSLQESIRFVALDNPVQDVGAGKGAPMLQQIRRAIVRRRTISFEYHTRHGRGKAGGAWSSREADPYGLVHMASAWYMVAYCHTRRDVRNFRIERIEHLQVLDKQFERPPGFKLEQRKERTMGITVRALFSYEVQNWVQESPSFYMVAQEEVPEGLLVTLAVRHESDVLQWLMSWGRHVRVLEPQSLIEIMSQEAEAILQNHQKAQSLLT